MMAAPFSFRGLIAPVLTPFTNDACRSLDVGVIPAYAKYLNDAGITGVLVNGTSGEGMSMTVGERKIIAESWIAACKATKQHVMVQVGGAPLPDVMELARHAERCGANSLLCLPELYFKPATCGDLENYLQLIGNAAPKTPLLYYHIPSMTNVNVNMAEFLSTVNTNKVPTFAGIKFTSTIMDEGVAAVNAQGGKFAVFLGADNIMVGAYALGFNSAIATTLNIYPELNRSILKNMQNGEVQAARNDQMKLNQCIKHITTNGTWVATMKEAMNLVTPIKVGPVRSPLKALTAQEVRQMENELKSVSRSINA